MKSRITICCLAVLVITGCLFLSAQVALATTVTGAGGGVFGSGVSLNTVPLTGLRFGIGIDYISGGSAAGDFQATLLGTGANGQVQEIVVAGKAAAGSSTPPGGSTFSGNCTLDMGNGTPPLLNVPFIVTLATGTDGKPTIAITVGATNLPAVSITKGSTTIK
jgi:hypothetical protein